MYQFKQRTIFLDMWTVHNKCTQFWWWKSIWIVWAYLYIQLHLILKYIQYILCAWWSCGYICCLSKYVKQVKVLLVRVSLVEADHYDLLTQTRYILMSKLRKNIFLIQTTSNYFWSSAVCNFLTFKVNFLCLKLSESF